MKPGMIIFTVSKKIPDGWLMCRGQHLKIEDYPELYEAIGFEYGGDMSTTFVLPRIPVEGVGLRPLIYTGK
jgi:microcystin-dependent protein